MRALLVASHDSLSDDVDRRLVAAGIETVRCHEAGAPAFPCTGLAGGFCPLDPPGHVDVAVAVRARPLPQPTLREFGLLCAFRLKIPIVVTGKTLFHPFEQWGATACEDPRDVVGACLATVPTSPSS